MARVNYIMQVYCAKCSNNINRSNCLRDKRGCLVCPIHNTQVKEEPTGWKNKLKFREFRAKTLLSSQL